MAVEETYLKQFTQKLLLSIEQTKDNDSIIQNGKTYINKESIIKLLTVNGKNVKNGKKGKNRKLSEPKKKYVH